MRAMISACIGTFLGTGLTACQKGPEPQVFVIGDVYHLHPITISFNGPLLSEVRATFTDYKLDATFTHIEDGDQYVVPGYYAGHGREADYGPDQFGDDAQRVWQVGFTPPKAGEWVLDVSFVTGSNVAIDPEATSKSAEYFDGHSLSFIAHNVETHPAGTDFRLKGFLQDKQNRYLEFSETGDFFIKTGAGSPENLLAYADFDGTYDVGGTPYPALGEDQLHEFAPHVKDWETGDPTWGAQGKGKGLIGLANYYESVGVNAQYIVTMNIEGDGQDVFPYVSHTDPYVFDVSKLSQWQRVFRAFNARGILIDMLLTETENESWFEAMDGDVVGQDFSDSRKLYYREMVARFGHLNGLVFNLGEENGVVGNSGQDPYRQPTSTAQRRAFAKYIRELDSFDHAVVSHNWPDSEADTYGPLLGEADFSGISLQAHYDYYKRVFDWTEKSEAAGRGWIVTVDEPLGWEYGARPDDEVEDHRREIEGVLWPVLMGGGAGVDWYFGWQNNAPTSDLSNEDQRTRHELWVKSTAVRGFFEDNFNLETLTPRHSDNYEILTLNIEDWKGHPVTLTARRTKPDLPEGEGHIPWEYRLDSVEIEHEGEIIKIDPMSPDTRLH